MSGVGDMAVGTTVEGFWDTKFMLKWMMGRVLKVPVSVCGFSVNIRFK